MNTLQPTSPDGEPFTVGVPLLPWEPELRGKEGTPSWRPRHRATREIGEGLVDAATWGPADFFDDLAVVAVVIGLGLLLLWLGGWLLPLAVLAVELVIAALLFVILGAWRTLVRRPWPVTVEPLSGATRRYQVVGYRRARRAAEALAAMIAAGSPLPAPGDFNPDRP